MNFLTTSITKSPTTLSTKFPLTTHNNKSSCHNKSPLTTQNLGIAFGILHILMIKADLCLGLVLGGIREGLVPGKFPGDQLWYMAEVLGTGAVGYGKGFPREL